jgi:hypothetical protein
MTTLSPFSRVALTTSSSWPASPAAAQRLCIKASNKANNKIFHVFINFRLTGANGIIAKTAKYDYANTTASPFNHFFHFSSSFPLYSLINHEKMNKVIPVFFPWKFCILSVQKVEI